MVRSDKIDLVNRVSDKLKEAESVILADFRGLTVAQMTDLRTKLRNEQIEFRVLKNRLAKRALEAAGCDALEGLLIGNTAWAFGMNDPVGAPKILSEFAKDNAKLVLKGGLLGAEAIDLEAVKRLAAMPTRPELLSMMAGGFKQPAVKLASAMNAGVAKVALAFRALGDKLEGSGESAA